MSEKKDDSAGPIMGWSIGTGVDQKALGDLLELPCMYSFKAVGEAHGDFAEEIKKALQAHLGRDLQEHEYSIRASAEGKYVSVTFHLYVTVLQEIYDIYAVMKANPQVKYLL